MNVERLHAIVLALRADLRAAQTVDALRNLASALTNLAQQQPSEVYQQALAEARQAFRTALAQSEVDKWPAAWQETLRELGLKVHLGEELGDSVEYVLSDNERTPQVAATEVTELADELKADSDLLDQLASGFERLQIGAEELGAGEAEVMVTIPRGAVHNNLPDLGREFRHINTILGPFVEIVTGSREALQVRAIASSDFGVYLQTLPSVATFIALSVERMINGYKSILEIRLLRQGMLDQNVPDEVLGSIDEHVESRMKEVVRIYVDEIVAERLAEGRDGREHELEMELRNSLNAIANRIDAGYNFDVRVGEPEPTDDDEDQPDDADVAAVELIRATSPSLKFINMSGARILFLPEGPTKAPPVDDDDPEAESQTDERPDDPETP